MPDRIGCKARKPAAIRGPAQVKTYTQVSAKTSVILVLAAAEQRFVFPGLLETAW
jgi:hypothetical protein